MAKRVRISIVAPARICTSFEEGLETALKKMHLHWERELEKVLCDSPDLIVIPEVCDRNIGFSAQERAEYYDYRGEATLNFFAAKAREHNCYITYPRVRPLGNGVQSNCVTILDRKGQVLGHYDKYHMVDNEIMDASGAVCGRCGDKAVIFNCDFGRVGVILCFDLNFTEIRELYKAQSPDIMLFPSMYHGSFMQSFWAYELRCYFVSAVAGLESAIINPVGTKIGNTTNYMNYVTETINLDYKVIHLDNNRELLAAAKKKYGSKIKVFDPGYLGSVLLTAETEELSAEDITREFGIKTLDEYLRASLELQNRSREGSL